MIHFNTFAIVLTLLLLSRGAAVSAEIQLPPKRQFHIYLLMGQSNMVGHGNIEEEDQTPHPRVFRLNYDSQWELAVEPIHKGSRPVVGVGPGLAFGKAMVEQDPTVTIGLVPCAVGGTLLSRWSRGGDLYSNALHRARIAMKDGTLAGVLWHQGENDSIELSNAETYEERLVKMINDFREDLGRPDLPFVLGQIGEFLYTRKDPTKTPHARMINDALSNIPNRVPNTACWRSTGLTHKGDEVHFDTRSEREMGRRYATEMIRLRKQQSKRSFHLHPGRLGR